jgi:hypothetical protein
MGPTPFLFSVFWLKVALLFFTAEKAATKNINQPA